MNSQMEAVYRKIQGLCCQMQKIAAAGGGAVMIGGIANFPATGDPNTIYVDTTTGLAYFWDPNTNTYKPIGSGASTQASVKSINTPTYTLDPADDGQILVFTSPCVITCPQPLRRGFNCVCWQGIPGIQVEFVAGAGSAVLNRQNFLTLVDGYSGATLNYVEVDTVYIQGDLKA